MEGEGSERVEEREIEVGKESERSGESEGGRMVNWKEIGRKKEETGRSGVGWGGVGKSRDDFCTELISLSVV